MGSYHQSRRVRYVRCTRPGKRARAARGTRAHARVPAAEVALAAPATAGRSRKSTNHKAGHKVSTGMACPHAPVLGQSAWVVKTDAMVVRGRFSNYWFREAPLNNVKR